MTTSPLDDPALPDLVSAAIEMLDQGLEPQIEEICRERPDLVSAVEQSLELAQRLPTIQRDSASHDRFVGRVLDSRYRLDARLGAGAMGVVYRGEDLELHRPVAIKILRSAILASDESEYRFTREAEVMAAIRHPSVITIFDRGQTGEDDPYLVMELLEGEPLSELLERAKSRAGGSEDTGWIAQALGLESLEEPSYLRTVVRWAADLASGLNAAHHADIFHRDVKPSNVFVGKNGRPMLLDFGIAARVSQATLTREGQALGTPAYMAPESLEANYKPGPPLDIYGLGATLYHMLTLRPPFAGTPSQILSSLVTKEPTPAFRLRPGLPRDLQAILDKAMARKPSGRYASAADFEADLRAFLDYRPVSARPVTGLVRTVRAVRRSPALLTGIGMAVLALVLFGGVQWRSAWITGQNDTHFSLWTHLDPNLTIMGVANRFVPDPEDRAAMSTLLDRAAEVCVDPLPTLLIRSSFRLDHGDLAGAAEDMADVADSVDTTYARELAARYSALPSEATSALDLDTEGLPDPVEAMDVYLAAYHLMRKMQYAEAVPLLKDPRLKEFAPAEELRILTMSVPFGELSIQDRVDAAILMYDAAVRLEAQTGRTATTAHLIGSALLHQERYDKALEVIREGIALAPRSHQLRMNAGMAAFAGKRYHEARAELEVAIELRPNYFRPYTTMIRLLKSDGKLEEAERLLEVAPLGASDAEKRWRLIKQGDVETERALGQLKGGDLELSTASAKRALARYEAASEYAPFESIRSVISNKIVEGDIEGFHPDDSEGDAREESGGVFAGVAELMQSDPINWRHLEVLLDVMPEHMNDTQVAAIRFYLESLLTSVAKSDEYERSSLLPLSR